MEVKQVKKRSRWVWGILGITALCILGSAYLMKRELKPLLDTRLKQLITNSSDSLYRLEYSYFDINVLTGSAVIRDFKLTPNLKVYQKMIRERRAPDNLYNLSVKQLDIRNFHPRRLYSHRKLNIDRVIIDKPTLIMTNRRFAFNDDAPVARPKTPYQLISKIFKELHIGSIELNDIDFMFMNKSDSRGQQFGVKNLNIKITDLLVDSVSQNDRNRYYNTRNIEVNMKNYSIGTPDSLYHASFENFHFSAVDRRLLLSKVKLTPRHDIANFYKLAGYAKDRFNLAFDEIAVNNIDIRRFTREQRLYAGSVDVNTGTVSVYNDNNFEKKQVDRTGKFPHQLLQRVGLPMKLDTLNIRNTLISYTELDRNSKRSGTLSFNNTSGTMYNLTNDSLGLSRNNLMKARLTTYILNSAKMNVDFVFNLTDPKGRFEYGGTIGAFNSKVVNELTKPLGMLEVTNGEVKKVIFKVSADEDRARGDMQFFYNNLQVQILKRDDRSGRLKNQSVMSTIANVFVIESDNPNAAGKFTNGRISYVRPATQSFFAYIWRSLFTGIKESVGVTREKEEQVKSRMERIKRFIDRMKDNKDERKERRQERRQKRLNRNK